MKSASVVIWIQGLSFGIFLARLLLKLLEKYEEGTFYQICSEVDNICTKKQATSGDHSTPKLQHITYNCLIMQMFMFPGYRFGYTSSHGTSVPCASLSVHNCPSSCKALTPSSQVMPIVACNATKKGSTMSLTVYSKIMENLPNHGWIWNLSSWILRMCHYLPKEGIPNRIL